MLIASHQLLELVFCSMFLLHYYIFRFYSFYSLFESVNVFLPSPWEISIVFTGTKTNIILGNPNC